VQEGIKLPPSLVHSGVIACTSRGCFWLPALAQKAVVHATAGAARSCALRICSTSHTIAHPRTLHTCTQRPVPVPPPPTAPHGGAGPAAPVAVHERLPPVRSRPVGVPTRARALQRAPPPARRDALRARQPALPPLHGGRVVGGPHGRRRQQRRRDDGQRGGGGG
jgi:hypothetical protein